MGCGPSQAAKVDDGLPVKASPAPAKPPQVPQNDAPHLKSTSLKSNGERASSPFENIASDDAFDSIKDTSFSKGLDATANSVSTLTSSNQSSVQPVGMAGRQSLQGQPSGSLGSTISRRGLAGSWRSGANAWALGSAVIVREDPRVAHIVSLACTIVKVPTVMMLTMEAGRTVVGCPRGVTDNLWLSHMCAWVHAQDIQDSVVIKDTLQDPRTQECDWVVSGPRIRFFCAVLIVISENDRLGVLLAMDTVPHPNMGSSSMMLGNLASMAARELDGQLAPGLPFEFLNGDRKVGPSVVRNFDLYWCSTLLLDVTRGKWLIVFANEAFRLMTGFPQGIVEGREFWEFFQLSDASQDDQDPWVPLTRDLIAGKPIELPPVVMNLPLGTGSSPAAGQRAKQEYTVFLTPHNEETADIYSIEAGPSGQYFASFLPAVRKAQNSVNSTGDARNSVPFPGLDLGPVIGKGSFGYVCRGVLGYLVVAVKIIEAESILKADADGNPLEASLTKGLRHPNIVQMLGFTTQVRPPKRTSCNRTSTGDLPMSRQMSLELLYDTPHGTPYTSTPKGDQLREPEGTVESWLLLEYCDGGNLLDGIDREAFGNKATETEPRQPEVRAILATAAEIVAAMKYLHSKNIVHGDLSGGNVLLATIPVSPQDQRGFIAKVADFGLSRQALTSKVETNSYGTVTHMPPELLNDGHLSKRGDVYAFGVLLYEMYTGQRAWYGMRHPQIIHTIAVLEKHPELPMAAPADLRELADECMHANPKARPTFEDIQIRLQKHLAEF